MVRRATSILIVGILVLALPGAILFSFEQNNGTAQYPGTLANTSIGSFNDLLKEHMQKTNSFNTEAVTIETSPSHPSFYSDSFSPMASNTDIVVFSPYGIPTGKAWHLSIDGQNITTTRSSASISIASGNYSYTYSSQGYSPLSTLSHLSVSSGTLTVKLGFVSKMSVSETLSLTNGSIYQGNFAPSSSNSAPIGILKDPKNNLTYVADSGLNKVFALGSGNNVVASISTGANPSELAYDSLNGYMYVTNSGSGTVSAINMENSVVANFSVGQFPFGITYNPSNSYLYVANTLSNNVTIIGTTPSNAGSIITSIQLPSGVDPFSSIYDPSTGSVLFTNFNGNNVISVIGTQISGILGVYGSPAMMAYDSLNGNVFVTDSQSTASTGSGYLTIIGASGAVRHNISLDGITNPFAISFDSLRNLLYITGANSNQIGIFNPVNDQFIDSVPVGVSPYGILAPSQSGTLAATNFGSGTVSFLNYTTPVSNVTFVQKGLPQGRSWSVSLNGVTKTSDSSSITFSEVPSIYNYGVSKVTGYSISSSSGNISIGSVPVTVNLHFSELYNASFTETGLPSGMGWGLNIGGNAYSTTGNSITANVTNGTYIVTYFVQGSTSFGAPSSSLSVNGSSVSEQVSFVGLYNMYLNEKGLFVGTSWTVNVSGTNYSSNSGLLDLHLPNGTYSFSAHAVVGYQLLSGSGNVTVDGSNAFGTVVYGKLFSVTVLVHGLFSGTAWEMNLGGKNYSSSLGNISVSLLNGSYKFSVFPVAGYILGTKSGYVTVDGSNATLVLNFTRLYQVTVKEEGLPAGQEWSVSVNGGVFHSKSSEISFNLTNGSYSFVASSIKGYLLKNSSGNFTIDGNPSGFTFVYERLYTVTLVEYGLKPGALWSASLGYNLGNSTGKSIQFNVTNGTYSYTVQTVQGYRADPSGGILHVSGANETIQIHFVRVVNVAFYECGVPGNTTWQLQINGSVYNSNGRSISLPLEEGSYSYQAFYYHYGIRVQISGAILLNSVGMNVSIKFPHLYQVNLFETGLEKGASWSVNLSGYNITSQNSTIVLYLQNGTYNLTISSSSNQSFHLSINRWAARDSTDLNLSDHGSKSLNEMPPLTVKGGNISVAVHFDESGSAGHHGHGDHGELGIIANDFSRLASYIGHIIDYAVTNMPTGIRLS